MQRRAVGKAKVHNTRRLHPQQPQTCITPYTHNFKHNNTQNNVAQRKRTQLHTTTTTTTHNHTTQKKPKQTNKHKANLPASFNVLKLAAPLLAGQPAGGAIVCVGAAVVHHGFKHHEAFAAAKGAVEALYKCGVYLTYFDWVALVGGATGGA